MRSFFCKPVPLSPPARTLRAAASLLLLLFLAHPALAKDEAPPSPDHSWSPPGLTNYEQALTATNNLYNSPSNQISQNSTLDLPGLINIAESNNPLTRVAWNQARQAAQAVGLTESAYYPYLAASAAAGYQHELATLTTVFAANGIAEDATLDLKWLLFDFGGRQASLASAREQLMAANVHFNATHQQIVFAVTKNFYAFNTARELVAVDESARQAADTVRDAVQARFDHGLATKPDALQAEQQSAQADYDLEAARGALGDAQVGLVESLGILPTTELQIASIPDQPFTNNPEDSLADLLDRALAQRPDLVARLAALRASQAEVRKARSDFYPKLSLAANAGWSKLDINAYGSPYVGNSRPVYGIGLEVDLPIFDGFARAHRLHMAEAALSAAESQLADTRNIAVSEVWKAYTDLNTDLRKQESADKLLTAAQSAFDAALESYRQGVGTYVDVANAQRYLAAARSIVVDTRSTIYTGTAALALSVGDLAKPDADAGPSHSPRSP